MLEIGAESGRQFDTAVVEAFQALDHPCLLSPIATPGQAGARANGVRARYSAPLANGPQIANVRPELAWMLTNRTLPSGQNVTPANSSPCAEGSR